MRFLLLFMWPVLGYSQLDTTLTYKSKEAHSITYKNDSATLRWKIDTINYTVPFDIRFTKTRIYIDGYGTYKITKHAIHGAIDSLPGYNYYELENGTHLTYLENWVYWEWPIVKKKTKMVVFIIK
jgi:hypothetical protein